MIEAACTSETSVDILLRTRQYIPEDPELQQLHIIIIIIIISCHRFSFFPGTSALEPVVNPTTQASSLSL
jgi:hypothetical protein